jgi:hypothetical protein
MTALIFILTILSILVLLVVAVIRLIRRKPCRLILRTILIIVLSYSVCWTIFYFSQKDIPVAQGTNLCFDDWCATVTEYEFLSKSGNRTDSVDSASSYVVLHVKMSNNAKGIAQKPSEPRIFIADNDGNYSEFSNEGQLILEKSTGKQASLNTRLELHQSIETQLVFDLPANRRNMKAIIEEGPFITRFIFNTDRDVFLIHENNTQK